MTLAQFKQQIRRLARSCQNKSYTKTAQAEERDGAVREALFSKADAYEEIAEKLRELLGETEFP